jgi:hypothetical protein
MVRTMKTDNTWKERQARKRLKDRIEKGIVGVTVKVHETRKDEIKAVAATMLEPREEEPKSEETGEEKPWPEGCLKRGSCFRNRRCMYWGCRHEGRSLAADIDAQEEPGT